MFDYFYIIIISILLIEYRQTVFFDARDWSGGRENVFFVEFSNETIGFSLGITKMETIPLLSPKANM